ncbi:hypothetical protein KC19_3G067800 [Ceratodon purpureus]|uniref:TOG domain-containing protein n=1 Tax=Ceratodon purpureus TaxID=3225 RepID=A0A8T0IGT1_CERPU|nr:hypothetical protein KC19_3G067800 [Ceratodon purpureus]
MAMAGGPLMRGGRRGAGQAIGKAALLIELKNRILATLHKLSDRDTQQLAVEELERIAQNLTPEGIALFLACLYDTDAQQKSVVRRECIRLSGTLASLHGDLLACHLPKMVGNIMRRLKDPDSNIRDACVETIGILASQIGGADACSAINVFLKPLLEALAEQHRNLQTGASMCLARVIECIKDPHPPTLQRLCPRIVKMLASPNFLAKASLLNAVGVMVQVPGMVSPSQLPVLLASVQEELDSSEWAVRKAAAETLSSMATAAGTALASYRGCVLAALENGRFDKVKPVRDSVTEALQLWKAYAAYDPNAPQGATQSGFHESASPTRFCDGDTTPPKNERRNSFLMKSGGSVNSSFSDTCGRPKSMPDRRANAVRKRTPGLSDKKANPDFFRKLEGVRDSIDWQYDIPAPCDSPQKGSPRAGVASCENLVNHGNCTDSALGAATPPPSACGAAETLELISIKVKGEDLHHDQEEVGQLNPPEENGEIACNGHQALKTAGTLEIPVTWEDQQANDHQNGEYGSKRDANVSSMNGADKTALDMIAIHRHFHSLERQQLSVMEMLQDSMVRVHESMQDLEGRVSRLEQIVDDMAHSSGNTEERCPIGESQTFQGGHTLRNYLSGNGYPSGKVSEENAVPPSLRSQDSLEKMTESTCGDSEEFTFGTGHQMPEAERLRRPNVLASINPLQKSIREDGETLEQVGNRRVVDRGGGLLPQGEGPSARSVWHASKDEAIAAIRGASVPSKPHNHRKHSGRDFNTDQKPHRVAGGPFWMMWSRAMESVRSGDLDQAYGEIIGSNDELLLVRLMGRTGPVLDQLGAATVSQLMGSIKQFLQQQSFLDCVIPWLQQVSDLVSSKGPNALGLMGEAKKDLVFALQEATSMEYAQSWMGAKIAELAEHLGNAWS